MRNIIIFIFVCVAVSAAIFGIFNLTFPKATELMGWCVASGIVMTIALASNVILISSHKSLTIRNAATSWCVNLTAICFFAWTLLFVFGLGDYREEGRNLNSLYIGYLIILIAGLALFFIADRGGSIAQAQNAMTEANIRGRADFLSQLNLLKLNVEQIVDTESSGEIKTLISRNIDLLRNIPASRFSSQAVSDQLSQSLMVLDEAIESNDTERIKQSSQQLTLILKSLRI